MEFSILHQNCIFFIGDCCIYKYNYASDNATEHCSGSAHRCFCYSLSRYPDYFVLNADHTMAFVAVKQDVIFINMQNDQEINIDTKYYIEDVKACIYKKGKFYILANRYKKNLGIFLLELDENKITSNLNDEG